MHFTPTSTSRQRAAAAPPCLYRAQAAMARPRPALGRAAHAVCARTQLDAARHACAAARLWAVRRKGAVSFASGEAPKRSGCGLWHPGTGLGALTQAGRGAPRGGGAPAARTGLCELACRAPAHLRVGHAHACTPGPREGKKEMESQAKLANVSSNSVPGCMEVTSPDAKGRKCRNKTKIVCMMMGAQYRAG